MKLLPLAALAWIGQAQAQLLTQLDKATVPLTGAELTYIVQNGVSKQVPISHVSAVVVNLGGNSVSAIANADAVISNSALNLVFSTAIGGFSVTSFFSTSTLPPTLVKVAQKSDEKAIVLLVAAIVAAAAITILLRLLLGKPKPVMVGYTTDRNLPAIISDREPPKP